MLHGASLSKTQLLLSYFENDPEQIEKAIVLYGKGGSTGRAIELCFRSKKFKLLQDIRNFLFDSFPLYSSN